MTAVTACGPWPGAAGATTRAGRARASATASSTRAGRRASRLAVQQVSPAAQVLLHFVPAITPGRGEHRGLELIVGIEPVGELAEPLRRDERGHALPLGCGGIPGCNARRRVDLAFERRAANGGCEPWFQEVAQCFLGRGDGAGRDGSHFPGHGFTGVHVCPWSAVCILCPVQPMVFDTRMPSAITAGGGGGGGGLGRKDRKSVV